MKTAGALSVIASLLMALTAHAGARDAGEPLVILTEQGSKDAEDTAFFSSIRSLAAEIGIVVSTEEVSTFQAARDVLLAQARGQRKPFLVTWILRENKTRQIHLFDPWKNQLRTRTIEAGESATANAEALALVLRAELIAYLHEPPPPAPPPPLPPLPPPPPARELRWALAASYSAGTFLKGQGLQQGARLGFMHMWHHAVLGVAYGLFPQNDVAGQGATIAVRRHPVDLDLGYSSTEYHRLRWGADLLFSGDWVSRHTSSATSPLVSQPDGDYLLVSAGAQGRQELRLLRNLALTLALGIAVPLNPIKFQIAHAATNETLAQEARIRFSVELGVKLLLF